MIVIFFLLQDCINIWYNVCNSNGHQQQRDSGSMFLLPCGVHAIPWNICSINGVWNKAFTFWKCLKLSYNGSGYVFAVFSQIIQCWIFQEMLSSIQCLCFFEGGCYMWIPRVKTEVKLRSCTWVAVTSGFSFLQVICTISPGCLLKPQSSREQDSRCQRSTAHCWLESSCAQHLVVI